LLPMASPLALAAGEEGSWAQRFQRMSPTEAFAWVISPMSVETFFAEYWEKKPLHIARGGLSYYEELLTPDMVTAQLRSPAGLTYEKDINLAGRVDGKQIMQNGSGRASAAKVSDAISHGCSEHVVHPQRFVPGIAALLSALETYFGCLWGSNSFRTPPSSGGFKAHHDEVEVFMLQLSGAKHWRLHTCPSGPLPRTYCWEYEEGSLGKPVMELLLQAGDLLYFPRGTVHRGSTGPEVGSHHLTISTYQRMNWAEFLSKALPAAVERAATKDARFRAGLPLRCLQSLGECHRPSSLSPVPDLHNEDCSEHARTNFCATFAELVRGLCAHTDAAVDAAGDFLAAQFVARKLPPPTTGAEAARNKYGPRPSVKNARKHGGVGMLQIRWKDPGAVRVVVETRDGQPETQVYHSLENSVSAHGLEAEPQPACLVLEGDESAPVLQLLSGRSPCWVDAVDLGEPLPWELLEGLWEHGLVETRMVGQAETEQHQRHGAVGRRRRYSGDRKARSSAGASAALHGQGRRRRVKKVQGRASTLWRAHAQYTRFRSQSRPQLLLS